MTNKLVKNHPATMSIDRNNRTTHGADDRPGANIVASHKAEPSLARSKVLQFMSDDGGGFLGSSSCVWRITDFRHKSAIRHTHLRFKP
jgi:hypothetical protein